MADRNRSRTRVNAGEQGTPPSHPIELSENARIVLEKRYLRRGADGKPCETIEEMFWRVAWHVAEPQTRYGGNRQAVAEQYYDLLTQKRFFPNSPTFTGAGTPLGQLAACFTAGMRVVTDQGLKRIVDLEVGDLVLTHMGRYRPVTSLSQRAYEGDLLRIKAKMIGTALEVTPEHPILTPRGWVAAGELSVGSKVAVGMPQGVRPTPRFDLAASVYAEELEVQVADGAVRVRRPSTYQNSGRQAEWVNRFVDVTPELARLCGYYVAEGAIGPEERYVRFTFGRDEREYQDDVVQLVSRVFGAPVNCSDSNHGQWTSVNVYSRAVAAWFKEQFGHGARGKRIPIWLQYADPEVQTEFLVGLMRGDGMYWEKLYAASEDEAPYVSRAFRLTLANPDLIQQVWQICLRLGYHAAIRPVDTTYVTANAGETAQVSFPPLSSRHLVQRAFGRDLPEPDRRYLREWVEYIDGQAYFTVESVERYPFSGPVYNCEVDEDHSYVTEGIVVHNCFVLPIDDDMGRTPDGIFQTLRNAALIQQTGGGNGFSFSRLRPKGARVSSSNGEATGPVGFLRVYDQAFEEISQGGARRGANMAVLRVDHPDIRRFITCKVSEDQITNFNISVGVTDAFMRAVEEDGTIDLIAPHDGSVWETVRAREIFDLIVKHAHHNGEPGMLFLDTANRDNPVPHLYTLEATNPCGEQWLGPYENCCLGSVNLAQHVTADGRVDWDKLRQTVELSTRFLDDVVDANKYVPAVPQLEVAAHRVRRIGLGIMGLADLMYRLGVRYGSREGQEFAAQVMEFVHYHCMRTSVELAKERGAFPAIRGSIFDPTALKWQPPTPLFPYERDWGRPPLDWQAITEGIKAHGIRNGAHTTIAPTGTISTVAGVEGYGCEPVFALAYVRYFDDNGVRRALQYTSPLFEQALMKAGLDEPTRRRIVEQVNVTGSCQDVPEVPEAIRRVFVVAADISAEEHVYMQAALQRFVSNSISKTCNFPPTATEEDVAKAFMLAWKLGCKGLTVYVAGTREKVVLETAAIAQARAKGEASSSAQPPVKSEAPPPIPTPAATPAAQPASRRPEGKVLPHPPAGLENSAKVISPGLLPLFAQEPKKPRARVLPGYTYRIPTPLGTTFVTINENGDNEPFEVFIHTSKAGSETAAVSEALGRLISYVLRLNSPVPPHERLKEVIHQLEGIGGGRSLGLGPNRVRSLPDGVAQVLAEYYDEHHGAGGTVRTSEAKPEDDLLAPAPGQMPLQFGDLCPECGEAAVVNEEGCRKCYACGYSEC